MVDYVIRRLNPLTDIAAYSDCNEALKKLNIFCEKYGRDRDNYFVVKRELVDCKYIYSPTWE